MEKVTKKNRVFASFTKKNSLHNSNQCCTLQQDAEKHKEERKKNGAKSQCTSKQEIHAIVEFARQAMELAKIAEKKEGEELNNFDYLSISTTRMSDAWKAGLGKSKSDKNIMHNPMDLDTKNNRTEFKSLDKCLNTSMTSLRTYRHPIKDRKLNL